MKYFISHLLLLVVTTYSSFGQTILLPLGASWKYLDNGSDQGTEWRTSSFDDSKWKSGNAQFGYGDGDEFTVVSYGTNSSTKYTTTYFRKALNINDISGFTEYSFDIKRDDGIVIYINGIEKYRNNMPSGNILYTTWAIDACSDDGSSLITASIPSSAFIQGNNIIAVEVHQCNGSSSDISFDMSITGLDVGVSEPQPKLTRGPYLQLGTPSSIIIRWRTDNATDSKVQYGTSSSNLNLSATDSASTTEHEVKVSGLTPNTKYFYSIGSTDQVMQGDTKNFFITAPASGTVKKTRIWVTGDCGNNSTNQINVRNQYVNYAGSNYTHIWLLLGDNAYDAGTDAEYQSKFFDIYKDNMLKQTVLWPAPGNHDYANTAARQNDHNISYYTNFTLPSNGEAGGIPSGTEAFYSFDYSNIHFIALDSYGKESNSYRLYDTLGPQVVWLKKDLAANTKKWTIVYWHHPPYTMGSHNSDTESELINIRQNLISILERYKVDLILCGHSHAYERTKLIKGHYGSESTFNSSTNNLSTSSAKYDGSSNSCPYIKSTGNNGTVYVVAGSAGQVGGTQGSWPHNAMHYSDATNGGSLFIEVDGNRLDARWICADGVIRDQFTIMKDVNKTHNVSVPEGQSATLSASWHGTYTWSPGNQTSRSISVIPSGTSTYSVKDSQGCLTDVYNIKVSPARRGYLNNDTVEATLSVFPNPTSGTANVSLSIPLQGHASLALFDATGRRVLNIWDKVMEKGNYLETLDLNALGLKNDIYVVRLEYNGKEIVQRLSVVR